MKKKMKEKIRVLLVKHIGHVELQTVRRNFAFEKKNKATISSKKITKRFLRAMLNSPQQIFKYIKPAANLASSKKIAINDDPPSVMYCLSALITGMKRTASNTITIF